MKDFFFFFRLVLILSRGMSEWIKLVKSTLWTFLDRHIFQGDLQGFYLG